MKLKTIRPMTAKEGVFFGAQAVTTALTSFMAMGTIATVPYALQQNNDAPLFFGALTFMCAVGASTFNKERKMLKLERTNLTNDR